MSKTFTGKPDEPSFMNATNTGQPDAVLNTVEEGVRAIAAGEMIVVVDDCDRENEGDLIVAASRATPEQVAFIVRHTSGIVCAPVTSQDARRLNLAAMVSDSDAPLGTAFTVSVDYKEGLTTGISAAERTNTLRALANGNVGAADFARPGHVFPLIAKDGGVLMRSGHTEAGVDLMRLAGLPEVAVLAELVNDDGTVKRLPSLLQFAEEHHLCIISIADLIAYRQRRERLVERVGEFDVITEAGPARGIAYSTPFDTVQHLALVFGDVREDVTVTTRIHRADIVKDVFEHRVSPEGDPLKLTLDRFKRDGRGVLIYLREGAAGVPGGALHGDSGAPASADTQATDTQATDTERARAEQWRDVGVGAQILKDLGVTSIRLLATRQRNYVGLEGFGIELKQTELLQD